MSYRGDRLLGSTFDFKFNSAAAGVPTTLAGSPTIGVYQDNNYPPMSTGLTLTVDFDSVTGLNNVRVVATEANGYSAGINYHVVVTAGTVAGSSVVGSVVGEFGLEAVNPYLSSHSRGVLQATIDSGSSSGAIIFSGINGNLPSAVDDFYNGAVIVFIDGALAGARTDITDYDGGTYTATVSTLTTAPSSGDHAVIV